jgi:ribosome-binding protein aMBF1 (putative translation factor)
MGMLNVDLKVALLKRFGSQIRASRRLNIQEAKLSHLVHGHDQPTERERRILEKALGADYFPKEEEEESQAGVRRGVMDLLADQTGAVTIREAPKSEKE